MASTSTDVPDVSSLSISSKKELSSSSLVSSLILVSLKSPSLVKAAGHDVQLKSESKPRKIWSWRMNEWKYSASPCPFPTLARGLFTEWVPESEKKWSDGTDEVKKGKTRKTEDGFHRIVARGYDKFFNMNEVRWNSVRIDPSMMITSYRELTRGISGKQ